MLLLFALALTGCIYLGPIFFPAWFAWEKEIAGIMLPIDYEWAKAGICIMLLLSAFLWHRKIQKRNKKIFYTPKRSDKGHLRLPKDNNHGNISIVIAVCMLALFLLLTGYSQAIGGIRMISTAKDNVNMRTGPGTGYKVIWVLGKGCPLKLVTQKGSWYKVMDFEGDTGWIYKPLTSRTPHIVVKKKLVNIRSLPGTRNSLVAKASKGTVFRTIGSVRGWVKVRHASGVTGWVARKLVWGW
ncbi:MAG: SH3 domain-containing protein [Thermodesulfobacteriota bacterium]|nr:SH3 domain-containing protein [Thermodesulfobacteriota bacterium]